MSDTEHHYGKLALVTTDPNLTVEYVASCILQEKGVQRSESYSSDWEYLTDNYHGEYIEVDGKLYQVIEHEEIESWEGITRATANSDGTISFEVRYYNGGCCMSEAIQEAVQKLHKTI